MTTKQIKNYVKAAEAARAASAAADAKADATLHMEAADAHNAAQLEAATAGNYFWAQKHIQEEERHLGLAGSQ